MTDFTARRSLNEPLPLCRLVYLTRQSFYDRNSRKSSHAQSSAVAEPEPQGIPPRLVVGLLLFADPEKTCVYWFSDSQLPSHLVYYSACPPSSAMLPAFQSSSNGLNGSANPHDLIPPWTVPNPSGFLLPQSLLLKSQQIWRPERRRFSPHPGDLGYLASHHLHVAY
ncbi:hypothetical protein FRC12_024869 [Ceratobasidium sp. 428]|nr:hypothetical protein FRC12_024869 [Ceratobasidium sp. 428]